MRKAYIAAGAIVGFGVAATAGILLLPSGGDLPASAEGPAPASAAAPAPGSGALPPLPSAPTGPIVIPQVVYAPAEPGPPPGSWEAVKPVARLAALGPPGAALGRELNEIQPDLSACFDEQSQANHGRDAISVTASGASGSEGDAPVLMLHLEMAQGEIRIVDAPVEVRGGASDGLIACAQKVLRGRTVKVAGARPGQKARVSFPLAQ